MDAEKLDVFRKSEGWALFCEELDELVNGWRHQYDTCHDKEDFVRIQAQINAVRTVKNLPEALLERQGAQA